MVYPLDATTSAVVMVATNLFGKVELTTDFVSTVETTI